MNIPVLGAIWQGTKIVRKIRRAIKEGKDVKNAIDTLRFKYNDLDDDAKKAWREVEEFFDAIKDIV